MRIVGLIVAVLCLAGCTAMMMSGGGGYQAQKDECTEARREAGECGQ